MTELVLFRGIAVPANRADEVGASIKSHGLSSKDGKWQIPIPDVAVVRAKIDELFANTNLTREDFLNSDLRAVCACGTGNDASYYAFENNRSSVDNTPLVIEFTAPLDDVTADPKDFLCTAFQGWDHYRKDGVESQRAQLRKLYGTTIERYFNAAVLTSDQTYRIAMCNLAAVDEEVVTAHYANRSVIGGRYRTRFTSAFFVKAPVEAHRIRKVSIPEKYSRPEADVTLDAFLGRKEGE